MKKWIALLVVIALCLPFCGCISQKDFDAKNAELESCMEELGSCRLELDQSSKTINDLQLQLDHDNIVIEFFREPSFENFKILYDSNVSYFDTVEKKIF